MRGFRVFVCWKMTYYGRFLVIFVVLCIIVFKLNEVANENKDNNILVTKYDGKDDKMIGLKKIGTRARKNQFQKLNWHTQINGD